MSIVSVVALMNHRTEKREDVVSDRKAIRISMLFGLAGLVLSSLLFGLGIADTSPFPLTQLELFAVISAYNFLVCLFIARAYPRSIWFAGFFVNMLAWVVFVLDAGMFVRLWHVLAAFVIFGYGGSLVGLLVPGKKRKQADTDQEEE
ncbi:MAG: hypothetical protein ACYDH4_02000 [Candidatus Cryosericum sp.]